MRIVAGEHRGARIFAPKGLGTRPTSDRVREAAFNLIGPVDGAAVLDLFAGSGAMGLEALSRGAASAVFVECDRDACRTIERNLEKLGLTGATVVCRDALQAARRRAPDVRPVLCDPPYGFAASPASRRATSRVSSPRRPVVYETDETRRARARRALRTSRTSARTLRLAQRAPYGAAGFAERSIDHRDLPRNVRPGHARARRRHRPRGDDLRPRRRRRRPPARTHKEPTFSIDERVGFLRDALAGVPNVEVDVFAELVVDFARRWEAKAIVKGLRVISDFEWEFQMNQLNRHLAPEIETVYVMASPRTTRSSPRAA